MTKADVLDGLVWDGEASLSGRPPKRGGDSAGVVPSEPGVR
jgi:hypothetical protein